MVAYLLMLVFLCLVSFGQCSYLIKNRHQEYIFSMRKSSFGCPKKNIILEKNRTSPPYLKKRLCRHMQTEDKGNYGAGFGAISSKVCTDVVR